MTPESEIKISSKDLEKYCSGEKYQHQIISSSKPKQILTTTLTSNQSSPLMLGI